MSHPVQGPRRWAWSAAGVATILLFWEFAALAFDSELILPSPLPVLRKLASLALTVNFARAAAASLFRVVAGFLLALPVALVVGVASGLDDRARAFTRPFFSVVAATPVLSIILIALLWFGPERVPIFTALLMVFPVMATNVREGVGAVDRRLVECARAYRLTRTEQLRHVYLPSLLPFVIAGGRSSLSLSWKVVVAAEVLAQPERALGTGMQSAKAQLETTELMAWTAATVILAALCDVVLATLSRRGRRGDAARP